MLLRRRETPSPRPSSSAGPGFVPFQLSDEQYASVCRAPEAHGYPTLASGEVAAHGVKFGYIFVEDRGSVEGRSAAAYRSASPGDAVWATTTSDRSLHSPSRWAESEST